MKLIVGLGNPGSKYELTRHNIGKRSVEALASAERLSFQKNSGLKAETCQIQSASGSALIAYPETYMNLSGEAVRKLADYYKIDVQKDLLIIVDEVALPFGTLRIRAGGSAGGHNGLASIEQHLGTQKYMRLRIGVGSHVNACDSINDFLAGKALEDYVLEKFPPAQDAQMTGVLDKSVHACRLWLEKPFEEAASKINIKIASI